MGLAKKQNKNTKAKKNYNDNNRQSNTKTKTKPNYFNSPEHNQSMDKYFFLRKKNFFFLEHMGTFEYRSMEKDFSGLNGSSGKNWPLLTSHSISYTVHSTRGQLKKVQSKGFSDHAKQK